MTVNTRCSMLKGYRKGQCKQHVLLDKLQNEQRLFMRTGDEAVLKETKRAFKQGKLPPWLLYKVSYRKGHTVFEVPHDVRVASIDHLLPQRRLANLISLFQNMRDRVQVRDYTPIEKKAIDIHRGIPGDCTDLARYAYARLKLAGFSPRVVFVKNRGSFKDKSRVSVDFHTCVAVKNPVGKGYLFVDLYDRKIYSADGKDYQKLPAESYKFISPLSMWAQYHAYQSRSAGMVSEKFDAIYADYVLKSAKNELSLGGELLRFGAKILSGFFFGISQSEFKKAVERDSQFSLTYYRAAHTSLWKAEVLMKGVRKLTQLKNPTARKYIDQLKRESCWLRRRALSLTRKALKRLPQSVGARELKYYLRAKLARCSLFTTSARHTL